MDEGGVHGLSQDCMKADSRVGHCAVIKPWLPVPQMRYWWWHHRDHDLSCQQWSLLSFLMPPTGPSKMSAWRWKTRSTSRAEMWKRTMKVLWFIVHYGRVFEETICRYVLNRYVYCLDGFKDGYSSLV